jgi:hypothetical protein
MTTTTISISTPPNDIRRSSETAASFSLSTFCFPIDFLRLNLLLFIITITSTLSFQDLCRLSFTQHFERHCTEVKRSSPSSDIYTRPFLFAVHFTHRASIQRDPVASQANLDLCSSEHLPFHFIVISNRSFCCHFIRLAFTSLAANVALNKIIIILM